MSAVAITLIDGLNRINLAAKEKMIQHCKKAFTL